MTTILILVFGTRRAPRNPFERDPRLPEEIPLTTISEVMTHATNRPKKGGGRPGVKVGLQQVDGLHLRKPSWAQVVQENVIAKIDKNDNLVLCVGDDCLSPYTLAGAIAFYEWICRAEKRILEGRPYGNPVDCHFHKFKRPYGL